MATATRIGLGNRGKGIDWMAFRMNMPLIAGAHEAIFLRRNPLKNWD